MRSLTIEEAFAIKRFQQERSPHTRGCDTVYLFNPGELRSHCYNPLDFIRRDDTMRRRPRRGGLDAKDGSARLLQKNMI